MGYPSRPQRTSGAPEVDASQVSRHYPGIRRLPFLGLLICVFLGGIAISVMLSVMLGGGLNDKGGDFAGFTIGMMLASFVVGPIVLVGAGMAEIGGHDNVFIIPVLSVLCYCGLAFYRFENIGFKSSWWLLVLVPIANLVVWFRCFTYQEGYVETRKLDTAGYISRTITLVLSVLAALVAAILLK